MATLYAGADNRIIRYLANAEQEALYPTPPPGTAHTLAFNAGANAPLVADLSASTDPYRLAGTALTKAGAPVAVAPPPLVFQAATGLSVTVRTTTATPTEILRRTLAPTTGYRAHLTLLAVDAGNGNLRAIEAAIVAKRLAAGALLVGTPVILANHQDAGASTWAVTASVSGNDFIVTVTGAAGRTIDWQVSGDVFRFAPAGLTD